MGEKDNLFLVAMCACDFSHAIMIPRLHHPPLVSVPTTKSCKPRLESWLPEEPVKNKLLMQLKMYTSRKIYCKYSIKYKVLESSVCCWVGKKWQVKGSAQDPLVLDYGLFTQTDFERVSLAVWRECLYTLLRSVFDARGHKNRRRRFCSLSFISASSCKTFKLTLSCIIPGKVQSLVIKRCYITEWLRETVARTSSQGIFI